jgi:hypothetical protein
MPYKKVDKKCHKLMAELKEWRTQPAPVFQTTALALDLFGPLTIKDNVVK